jgi:tetratricopeptide (TPR) repeat protein
MAASAIDRASHHYLAAMNAIDAMPTTPELRRRWLSISSKWGLPFSFSPVRSQLHVLDTAVHYASEIGELATKAKLWQWLGWVHYSFGNHAESVVRFREGWELAIQLGDQRLIAQCQAGVGQNQAATGDYQAALETLTTALESKRSFGRKASSSRVAPGFVYGMACLGLVRADQGEFEEADRVFEEGLLAVRGSKHAIEGSAAALHSIALLWRGRWEEARATAGRGQQNARLVNSAFNMLTCGFFNEYATWELTRSAQALKRMQVIAEWIESQHLELFASCDYGWLAEALVQSGEPERARSYVERALKRASLGDPLGEASAYRALAQLAAEANNPSEAEIYLARAMLAGQRRSSPHEDVKTLLLRAKLCARAGDREASLRWAEACASTAQGLGMHVFAERARELVGA